MTKQSRAVVVKMPFPMLSMIYATNCIPLSIQINFPPPFTEEDRDRTWEALRLIYDEVTDRDQEPPS